MEPYENLSREDLIHMLSGSGSPLQVDEENNAQALLQNLQLHQIELEIQNRDLRETQQALEETRDRYAQLYDFAPVGYLTLDRNGIIQNINLTAAALLGRERLTVLKKPLGPFLARGANSGLYDHLRRAFGTGKQISGDLKFQPDKNGAVRDFRLDSKVWTDSEGGKSCLTTLIDITEHKYAEQALRARERQQAAVADLGQHALSNKDLQKLLDTSVAMVAKVLGVEYCKVLELGPGGTELMLRAGVGWHPGLVGHATVDAMSNSQAGYTLARKDPVIVEDLRRERRFSGPALLLSHQVVSGLSCVIAGPEGRPWGVLGAHTQHSRAFTRDDVNFLAAIANVLTAVIERYFFNRTLRDSEARLRQLADAMPQLVWTAEPDGTVDYYNRCLNAFDGIHCGADGNWTWQSILHPDDIEHTTTARQAALDSGQPYKCEQRVRMVDGSWRWHLSRCVPVRDAVGSIDKWYGTATDIHDMKLAQEALQEADRRKDEFLATLAHELRNPLTPIRHAVEILNLHGSSDPSSKTLRDIIDRQSRHMVRLIDDLLDVNRVNRGTFQLRKEHIKLADVLEQALEASRPHVERMQHELIVSLPPQPIYVDADPVRLAQVFLNLLNNACKFTEKAGHIRLFAELDGTHVVTKVTDSGIGIPPEHLSHIFDMFSQAHSTLEQHQTGLGIGLSLARGLVAMHGGDIEVNSDGPGKGSEFTVRLPILLETPASQTLPVKPSRPEPTVPRRVLIVDDDRTIVLSLAMILRLKGNEVETAYDGLEAIEMAEHFHPDVVLLDIGMPKLDGYATCRRIREQSWGKDLAVIALSGWSDDEHRQKSREAGFNEHLIKPVSASTLLNLIDKQPHRKK